MHSSENHSSSKKSKQERNTELVDDFSAVFMVTSISSLCQFDFYQFRSFETTDSICERRKRNCWKEKLNFSPTKHRLNFITIFPLESSLSKLSKVKKFRSTFVTPLQMKMNANVLRITRRLFLVILLRLKFHFSHFICLGELVGFFLRRTSQLGLCWWEMGI